MTPRIGTFAGAAALFVLATGALFGWNEAGMWSDLAPAAGAALLLALSAFGANRRASSTTLLAAAAAACLAALASSAYHDNLSWLVATLALLAGTCSRSDFVNRRAILGGAALLLALAFYQRWILFPELAPLFAGEARARLESGRVFSSFMLPAQFSAYLAVVFPIAVASALTDRFPRRFELGRLIAVLVPVGLVLTKSLSGVVAAAAALVVLSDGARRITTAHLLLAAALVLVLALRREELLGSAQPFTMRLRTWEATILGACDAPFKGHGAGSFERLFMAKYFLPGADEVRHPHSWPLKILFEHGLVGLALWIAIAAQLFRPMRDRSWRAATVAFFVATLLDVADLSLTLRALGFFALGASLPDKKPERPTA